MGSVGKGLVCSLPVVPYLTPSQAETPKPFATMERWTSLGGPYDTYYKAMKSLKLRLALPSPWHELGLSPPLPSSKKLKHTTISTTTSSTTLTNEEMRHPDNQRHRWRGALLGWGGG